MAIYDFFNQTVDVKRVSTGGGTVSAPTQVLSGVRALLEPISTKEMEGVYGRIPSAVYRMTWGTEDIRSGDVIVWGGSSYVIKETLSDTLRGAFPYQTGILTKVAGGR